MTIRIETQGAAHQLFAPEGTAAILERPDGTVMVRTQDGRTYVAIDLEDAFENAVRLLRKA